MDMLGGISNHGSGFPVPLLERNSGRSFEDGEGMKKSDYHMMPGTCFKVKNCFWSVFETRKQERNVARGHVGTGSECTEVSTLIFIYSRIAS